MFSEMSSPLENKPVISISLSLKEAISGLSGTHVSPYTHKLTYIEQSTQNDL